MRQFSYLKLWIWFQIALPLLVGIPTFADQTLVIGAGRSTLLHVQKSGGISVSNGTIVKVTDLGKSLKVTGKKSGTVQIRSGDKTYLVTVLSELRFALFQLLETAISNKRGLLIEAQSTTGSGVIAVTGRLLRWSDWLELANAAKNSPQDYFFEAKLEGPVQAEAKRYFAKLLREAGLPDLPLRFSPDASVTLPLEPEDLKGRVQKVLRPFGFKIERSATSLGLEPLVRVKMIVAELNKTKMRRYGITWPAGVDASVLPTASLSGPIDITINTLEQRGIGKVLASPVILCRSGKEAHFLAGGEFPIKLTNPLHSEVTWKNYGVLLNVRPRADFSGRMSIGVETEVSLIDTANVVDGIPGLRTNRIETHFDLTSARTIALSGLLKEEWGRSASGLPGLANLPVLGPLFSSRDFRDDKTELVVFVTPEVIHPDQEEL